MFSCNLRCLLIFLHGRSRTYRVASLRAGPVGRISYNLYFDCKHVRYVTCDFNKRIILFNVCSQGGGLLHPPGFWSSRRNFFVKFFMGIVSGSRNTKGDS